MSSIEKREVERYQLSLKARLMVLPDSSTRPASYSVNMETKNISSSGAFFVTDAPFRIGTLLDVELCLPLASKDSNIQVKGSVIRIGPNGMAVQFLNQYQIKPGD